VLAGAAAAGRLTTTEEKNEGAVKFAVWLRYFQAAGAVRFTITVLLLSYAVNQLAQIVSQWWVTYWTSDPQYVANSLGLYMGIYVVLGVAAAIFSYLRVIVQLFASIRSSRALHAQLLHAILHAPLSESRARGLGAAVSAVVVRAPRHAV